MAENQNEFDSMRNDAIRRVREMQRRAKLLAAPESVPTHENEGKRKQPELLSSLFGGSKELFDLSGIHIDEEKALIGLLIYILYKQEADIKLLLALGYLLL